MEQIYYWIGVAGIVFLMSLGVIAYGEHARRKLYKVERHNMTKFNRLA